MLDISNGWLIVVVTIYILVSCVGLYLIWKFDDKFTDGLPTTEEDIPRTACGSSHRKGN